MAQETIDIQNEFSFLGQRYRLPSGKVQSVSVNGQTKTPDSQGNVDLGNIVGQQGPAGNTYLVDENFDPVSMIINNLDESDGTVAMSARQGKILKQNVEALWSKVNALINDLAAMAFTGTKTSGLGTIDWTGGTFYATIVKSLTGCTATDNTTNGQIAEGTQLVVQLTALSNYTLTGATISVTDSRGQAVAYTLANNTLTIAAANVVGTINISVVAKAVYSVTNNDTHATLSNSTPANPTHGGSWSGTLSAASGYGLSATPSVTMGGVAVDFTASGNSWNRSTGAMTIGNVTGNIVIISASAEVVAHTVTKKLLNYTASDDGTSTTDADFGYKKKSVEDGDDYSVTLSLANSATSNNDLLVKMGGVALDTDNTKTSYYTFDSSNGALVVKNVTGDVTIIATAATGNIKVTSSSAVTNGITINGTAYNLSAGDTTINNVTAISSLSIAAKTEITAIDFGGATTPKAAQYFGHNNIANACTALTSVKGLVLKVTDPDGASIGECAYQCSALTHIDTIGWEGKIKSAHHAFSKTALTALDLEDLTITATDVTFFLSESQSLAAVVLPYIDSAADLKQLAYKTALTEITIKGSGVVSLYNLLGSCTNLTFIDFSGMAVTSSMTNIVNFLNGANSNITMKVGTFDLSGVSSSSINQMNRITTLICTTNTPPDASLFTYMSGLTAIYVPDNAVNTYKGTTGWSDHQSIIHSINDYNA